MKRNGFLILCVMSLSAIGVYAQTDSSSRADKVGVTIEQIDSAKAKKKGGRAITAGPYGIRIGKQMNDDAKVKVGNIDSFIHKESRVEVGYFFFDFGLNFLRDMTNYNMPQPQSLTENFANVPGEDINKNLMALRNGRSWNVDIYPVMVNFKLIRNPSFNLNLNTGLGLQIYNFRFKNNISFTEHPNSQIYLDNVSFTKDKLSIQYLAIPLMIDFKNKLDDKHWLVYGVGVQGGYRLSSWTKQVSGERGKEKNRDPFNFNDYNFSIVGEVGIDNWVKLYVNYQLTNIYNDNNSLLQYPVSFGIRLGGF